MIIEYRNKFFASLFDRGDARLIESVQLFGCEFNSCGISLTKDIHRRTVVRNVDLIRCRANNCSIGPSIIEHTTIESLATGDLLLIWGALFNQVKISGSCGKFKVNRFVDPVDRAHLTQDPFDQFHREFYETVDWALDIRDARFRGFETHGIPARLFRRDPESQVIVTRERALNRDWRSHLSPSNKLWPFVIDLFLSDGYQDTVLVAPLGAPKHKRDDLLKGLHELRLLGVTEPD